MPLTSTAQAPHAALLPLPPAPVETPCFVILEAAVLHNLRATSRLAGGVARLMPHVKTHRAPWLVGLMVGEGVRAFKAATPAEVEMVLESGGRHVVWAYPTANPASIHRVAELARSWPQAGVEAVVDSRLSAGVWRAELHARPAPNLRLRVDLDPGMGRTGLDISGQAQDVALALAADGLFAGWHLYDGHIHGADRAHRTQQIGALVARLRVFLATAASAGLAPDLVAGGSYSFDQWPADVARWVSPGSWTYSSAQHADDLPEFGWRQAAYVVASVVSARNGTVTLDAGSKAVSPDVKATERFVATGTILFVKEEHAVLAATDLQVGQLVALVPRHACTAAYLYDSALVCTADGAWRCKAQLGASR